MIKFIHIPVESAKRMWRGKRFYVAFTAEQIEQRRKSEELLRNSIMQADLAGLSSRQSALQNQRGYGYIFGDCGRL